MGLLTEEMQARLLRERAAQFYRHFDFHDFGEGRLWRRLSDIVAVLGASG